MKEFKFEIGDYVSLTANTNEFGRVVARAQYERSPDSYLIYYKAADGRSVESWWSEERLVLVEKGTDILK